MPDDSNPIGRAIRRAQLQAARAVERRQEQAAREMRRLFELALADLQRDLAQLADAEGVIPLERMPEAERIIRRRLDTLADQRDSLVIAELSAAAGLGANAFSPAASAGVALDEVRQSAVDFVREFRDANGLQLSDRLWRVSQGARERVIEAVESAIVQGHSAAQAARRLVTNGEAVPEDLLSKAGLARIREIQQRAGDALLTSRMNPFFQAERVMRTEINRAYGETAVRAAAQHPDVIAVRFVLSPRHPKFDICDMHASANRHGLGPGVYPIDNHPWPAHPNTLSYLEPVFVDEITDEDRAGKQTMTEFLNSLTAEQQDGVLDGQAKGWAWRQGLLDPRQVQTPWKKIAPQLQKRNIDIPARFMP